ncbi:cellulose synthase catalytic subunit [Klebsiella pneumoniae]|uniref:Cellulose synthase catalytic subunit n=1 Tax=Klebsiella pneumoniae TaxID=573 RepID=A0A377UT71_KLEPN|nr:cellulose synthase catalytic subunit [Klebsiella pneumoniae]
MPKGEFVSIFDCDHVPTRSFLQMTMGWFLKEKELAMMQTPHHFFSPDPFERNLGRFRKTPNEGTLFYGLVQDGNDMWDATFFCGSCAVIRRGPLDEIGGIAVETVTEDAHTSLRLHRRGIYLRLYAYSAGGGAGDGEFIRAYRPAHPLGARDGADIPPR